MTTILNDENANVYLAVKIDGDEDAIVFTSEAERDKFLEKKKDYTIALTSGVYKTCEDALAIWGE